MDWMNLEVSQSSKEGEAGMSSLIVGFSTQMRKRAANAQEETTPDLEVLGAKHPISFRSEEEVQVV